MTCIMLNVDRGIGSKIYDIELFISVCKTVDIEFKIFDLV